MDDRQHRLTLAGRIEMLRNSMERSLLALRVGKANDARIYLEQELDWLAHDEASEQATCRGIASGTIADEVVSDGEGRPWYITR